MRITSPGKSSAAGATTADAAAASVPLNEEQLHAAHAPLDKALAVLAAAGTGKTTTMLERCRYMALQGVDPKNILVLTFSRKAQAEAQSRLASVPGLDGIGVHTFHAWSWQLVKQFWPELGFARPPTLLASEEQLLTLMRDCLVWDRLAEVQAAMRSWLFLPPSAGWADIAAAAAERHMGLYSAAMRAALEAHQEGAQLGSFAALTPEAAAAAPLDSLPPLLQMLLLLELHATLQRRFDGGSGGDAGAGGMNELLAAASRAPAILSWMEAEKRQGRMPDDEAYAALCAQHATGLGLSEPAERHRCFLRVAAACHAEQRRLCLVSLSDLLLLARALLQRGGEALRWAHSRWSHVLVDEFQDTSPCMLDLLKLQMGERRSVTVVGDDDQAIFSFIAAVPAIFRLYCQLFDARLLCLQTNFRSSAAICAFGSSLLLDNHGRAADKRMLPARGGPCSPVSVRQFATPALEAEALAAEVDRLWRQEGMPLRRMAALHRCLRLQGAAPHEPLMTALRRRGIPYEVVGQSRLAEDEGVAALISYLALVANPACDPAFEAVLRQPYHALSQDVRGAVAEQRHAARLAGQAPPSLFECAELLCTQAAAAEGAAEEGGPAAGSQVLGRQELAAAAGLLPQSDLQELRRLVGLLRGMQQAVGREPLAQAVRRVLHESGLAAWVRQQQGAAALAREGHDAGCDSSQETTSQEEAEQLPPRLHSVVVKAEQLAAKWQQQGSQVAGPGSDGWHGWLEGGLQGDGGATALASASQQHQQGLELVIELLVRLATETTVDMDADAAGSCVQQAQQAQGCRADPGALTISTIHAAKGLEWDVVLLPSVCDGHLPVPYRPSALQQAAGAAGAGSCGEPPDHGAAARAHYEEERRLFHVAATRAKDLLLVSYVQPVAAEGAAEEVCHMSAEPPQAGRASTQQQQQQIGRVEDPNQLPRCSSILAATLRRLRREGADPDGRLLHFVGRLPEQDFPGLWRPLAEEASRAGRPAGAQRSVLAAADGNSQPRLSGEQLSLAERCRQRLAAKAGGPGGRSGSGLRAAGVAKQRGSGRGRGLRTAAPAALEPG